MFALRLITILQWFDFTQRRLRLNYVSKCWLISLRIFIFLCDTKRETLRGLIKTSVHKLPSFKTSLWLLQIKYLVNFVSLGILVPLYLLIVSKLLEDLIQISFLILWLRIALKRLQTIKICFLVRIIFSFHEITIIEFMIELHGVRLPFVWVFSFELVFEFILSLARREHSIG